MALQIIFYSITTHPLSYLEKVLNLPFRYQIPLFSKDMQVTEKINLQEH